MALSVVRTHKTNFHSQDVPYDMYCNATVGLWIDWVYKYSRNCHPQVYAEECKCIDAESKQCGLLSDSDGMDILRCKGRYEQIYRKLIFCKLAKGYKKQKPNIPRRNLMSKKILKKPSKLSLLSINIPSLVSPSDQQFLSVQ